MLVAELGFRVRRRMHGIFSTPADHPEASNAHSPSHQRPLRALPGHILLSELFKRVGRILTGGTSPAPSTGSPIGPGPEGSGAPPPSGSALQEAEAEIARLRAVVRDQTSAHEDTIRGVQKDLGKKIEDLQAELVTVREAATDRARQLQERRELDYQILMTHQQILAGIKDIEPEFIEVYERCKPFTMTSAERLYNLYSCVAHVARAGVPGDIAECGVWRGGSCMMAALALLKIGDATRRILLFDTFEGHPRPDPERDVDLWGNRAVDEWERHTHRGDLAIDWGNADVEDARANMASTGYPQDNVVLFKGKVEDTVPANTFGPLSILRLDTDWYESTLVALRKLYPLLSRGGVLILDDYGHYKGQKQAVHEYFAEVGQHPLLHRIDYSCRVLVKA